MAETIKSFIDKLQSDGVEAGQKAAETIRAEAEAHSRQILQQAEKQANEIIGQAHSESEKLRTRVQTEMKLAARDTVIRLQETLIRILQSLLTVAVQEKLSDMAFIEKLLHQIVMEYVRADVGGKTSITINVSEETRRKLTSWTIQTLQKDAKTERSAVDLRGTLSGAGFEYTVVDGTIEITVDSVVQALSELVGPEVRRMLAAAMADSSESDDDNENEVE
jgi:vacuolar-type H+-ATPase subunit E/Vma4